MKVYMKPVKMLSYTQENGIQIPLRFQLKTRDDELITVKIDRITEKNQEKLAGNKMYIYKCQSIINGVERIYELKLEASTMKWYLYKM